MTPYRSLALQTAISGVIMYLVMFVMIDQLSSFYNNLNMLYMTLMMVAPMVVLMIVAMRHMFASKAANIALIAASLVAFFGSFALIRTQTTIGDTARRVSQRAFLADLAGGHAYSQDAPTMWDVTFGTAVAQAPVSEPARPHAEAAPALCGECVRVVDVHQETRKGKSSGVGAVGGAVLGGLLGNQVGGGNGRKLATIGGAVAGGYAGNEIEKNRNARHVWVLKLSRADGSTQRLEQGQDPGVVPGDVVIVRNGHVERQAR